MGKFQFFDHTGDLGIRISGGDLPELFRLAAAALFEVITDPKTIRSEETTRIALQGQSLEELLISWLNEFIYLFESKGLLFRDFHFLVLNDQTLEAVVRGEPYDASRHPIKTTVKSATYHQLQVRREKGLWKTQVILDL